MAKSHKRNADDAMNAARFQPLYTGLVADILDDLKLRKQWLGPRLRPLSPDMKIAGPAYPVRGRARVAESGDDPRYRQIEMIEAMTPGCIVAVDPGGEKHAAHWGELMSRSSRAQGAAGAVVAGHIRDSAMIKQIGFPVFHETFSPLTALWRFETTDFLVPISINDVEILPGDFLFGDIDGVLVIPKGVVAEVLAKAEELSGKEKLMRTGLGKGQKIRDLFEKHKAF